VQCPKCIRGTAKDPGLADTCLRGSVHFRRQGNFTPPEEEVFLAIPVTNGRDCAETFAGAYAGDPRRQADQ
jgi:hypothetical protein